MAIPIPSFPIEYNPVNYGFYSSKTNISGVGVNVSLALKTLGDQVTYLSMVGEDLHGEMARKDLENKGLDTEGVLPLLKETPETAVLFAPDGRRQIWLDLKEIQETTYPLHRFQQELQEVDLCVLTTINFSRPFLEMARKEGKKIAVDLHVYSDLEDPYNKDFLHQGDIVFLSNEHIPGREESFMREILKVKVPEVLVVGMGDKGLLYYHREEEKISHIPAVKTRPLVNTIGAGDALFSCFIHFYSQGMSVRESLKRATLFASWKIGESTASQGFLEEKALLQLVLEHDQRVNSPVIPV